MKALIVKMDHKGDDVVVNSGRVIVDSAMVRAADPLFIPDHLGEWTGQVCPAVRISRLGTNIPEQFANRYYDAISFVMTLEPAANQIPKGLLGAVDRTLALGNWLPLEDFTDKAITLEVNYAEFNHKRTYDFIPTLFQLTVSRLSKYTTLKTGDIIGISPSVYPEFKLRENEVVEAFINEKKALNVRLK